MATDVPLILLPGMAADARLFGSQFVHFPNLRVPAWIDPLVGESLRAYAVRFARAIDPGSPCVLGGASFGGIVALEAAAHLRHALACVLIGSIRSPAELSWQWRILRPLAILGPNGLRIAAEIGASLRCLGLGRGVTRRLQRLARPEAAFVRWATCAVLRWQPGPGTRRVRVFQIHGERDHMLPATRTRADRVVPGGHHALSLFNPSAVNTYLAEVLEFVRRSPGANE